MRLSFAISAGEASGDLNGAHLAGVLFRLRDGLQIWGAGGDQMRGAGVDVLVDMSGCAAIGVAQSLIILPKVYRRFLRMRRELLSRKPDLFIPVDFGAFNIPLGKAANRQGIATVYYFPPSSWRKTPRSASRLLECGGKVVTPFPWSAEILKQQGVDARFVGHPLLDIARPALDRASFLQQAALEDAEPLIALFPGSRAHEYLAHLPPMLDCVRRIRGQMSGARFVLGAAPGAESAVRRWLGSTKDDAASAVRVVAGRSYECLAYSDLAIACSGTATLEAAVIGTPMVIIYRGTPVMRLEYIFRRGVVERFIGMPNIIAGREICPELVGSDVTGDAIADQALPVLQDGRISARMRSDLAEVRKQLGEPGSVERAAQAVLELGGLS